MIPRGYRRCPDCSGYRSKTAKRCRDCNHRYARERPRAQCSNGCGRAVHAKGMCKACRRLATFKPCPDCGDLIAPKSTRCVPCANVHRRMPRDVNRIEGTEAEERRERMRDPEYAARIERNRRMLTGYLSAILR